MNYTPDEYYTTRYEQHVQLNTLERLISGDVELTESEQEVILEIAHEVMLTHDGVTDRNDEHRMYCAQTSEPWPCPEHDIAYKVHLQYGGFDYDG